jgi:hypothetical protein
MKHKVITNILLTALCLLSSVAWASTTWYVNGASGNDGNNCTSSLTACKTIGHAISLASSGDSIRVAPATYTENLTISVSLKIFGTGAKATIIDGGGVGRVLNISNGNVTLSGLAIRNGAAAYGGGIFNGGTLLVIASTISGNRAKTVHYCLYRQLCKGAEGGGIYNSNLLTIRSSTLVGNSAEGSYPFCAIGRTCFIDGGGIFNQGKMIMSNSTLADNTAFSASGFPYGRGGGISNVGTAIISNSTLSGNAAYPGGGISGAVAIQNSIVANSPSGGNCNGAVTSNGYNLSSDGTCNLSNTGDLNNTDPMLGALQNNGGPTQTMALLPGSPAIDAGNPSGCTDGQGHLLKTDQRGAPRPDKEDSGGCDMGAYERQSD